MNIVIIASVYPPELVVSAGCARDLAQQLFKSGHEVTVLCPRPTRPKQVDYAPYWSTGRHTSVEEGIRVVRILSYAQANSKLFYRIRESFSFGWEVYKYLASEKRLPDVIFANTWPLLSQAFIAFFCKVRLVPFVLNVQDIYPESLLGKLPSLVRVFIGGPLTVFDTWIARQAQRVVVISEHMRRVYIASRDLPENRVICICNWQDESRFDLSGSSVEPFAHYHIDPNLFNFVYLGNIGPVAGVEFLIQAFSNSKLHGAQLLIAGDGSSRDACILLAKELCLKNVHFIKCPGTNDVPLIQSMADILLLPMKPGASMSSMPSKLIAYLFSGKPIIATVDLGSDAARCINEAKCGWVGESQKMNWLVSKMKDVVLAGKDAELKHMGNRGRVYGLANFSRREGAVKMAHAVTEVVVCENQHSCHV